MEKKATTACFIVGIMGVAAAAAGFAAEATRVKVDEVYISVSTATCFYPSSPAYALGIAAAVILFVSQIILNITTGFACCSRKAPSEMLNNNTTLQRVFSTISWIAFIAAFVMFLVGTVFNRSRSDATLKGDYYWCYVVKPGIFAGASVLTLVSIGAGIGYINLVFKPAVTTNDVEGQGQGPVPVPVGQPQFNQKQQPQHYNAQAHQQLVAQPHMGAAQPVQYPQQQMVAQPHMGAAQPVQYPPPNPHY